MEAQTHPGFQDPLSAAVEESERASVDSLDNPTAAEAPGARDSPTLSMNRQAADGSEEAEKAVDQDEHGADTDSAWTPEVLQSQM